MRASVSFIISSSSTTELPSMVVSESLVLTGLAAGEPRFAPGGVMWFGWVTAMAAGPLAACMWASKLNGFRSCGL